MLTGAPRMLIVASSGTCDIAAVVPLSATPAEEVNAEWLPLKCDGGDGQYGSRKKGLRPSSDLSGRPREVLRRRSGASRSRILAKLRKPLTRLGPMCSTTGPNRSTPAARYMEITSTIQAN